MRPLRIELEGFGSFRQPTDVGLADTDLFVLSGPTGAGKTTIVESAVFALFGTVPRYDDRRLVAPVINQNRNEARVRLTFAVGDRTFQATRVVRRRDGGATTKEARLEEVTDGGHRTLAGTADELTEAVEDLLGLTFEQFTRSVVLPQGAFDRFLFAKPSDRADLLVQLLDLGVYEAVGRRARALASRAEVRAAELQRQLDDDLADATEAARDGAAERVRVLNALARRCDEVQPQLDAIQDEGTRLRERAAQADAEVAALAGLTRPDGLDDLAASLRAAGEGREVAASALAEAAAEVEAAGTALAALPDAAAVAELQRLLRDLAAIAARQRDDETELAAAREAATAAAADEQAAVDDVGRAREALDDARRDELAQTLARHLHPGDDCPVCGATVTELPSHGEAPATAAAEQTLAQAEARLESARQRRRDADQRVAGAEAGVVALQERAGDLDERRGTVVAEHDLPDDADRLAVLAEQVAAARNRERAARDREAAARKQLASADDRLAELRRRSDQAWHEFDAVRDRVARLEPPRVDRDDLGAAWDALLAWADDLRPRVQAAAADAQAAVDDAARRYRQLQGALRSECADAGVDVPPGTSPVVAVTGARTSAQHHLDQLEKRLARAAEVRDELARVEQEQQVAEALGRHLRADGFERWLLARALQLLVTGASTILHDLTSGAYSLALDDASQFLVVDHRNADELRTVKSLSGGERFLASLALALALAEHVAELAAEGAARLESLFLDEGFGTLDAATLDTVASALEELGARGRVVGVITHVRELADRLPVRFEVRRGPAGSTVERLDDSSGPVHRDPDTDAPDADSSSDEDAA